MQNNNLDTQTPAIPEITNAQLTYTLLECMQRLTAIQETQVNRANRPRDITSMIGKLPSPDAYYGKRDGFVIRTFCTSIRAYFEILSQTVSSDELLRIFELFLKGEALRWYHSARAIELFETYEDALVSLQEQFDPPHFEKYLREKLYLIKQRTTVKALADDIRRISTAMTEKPREIELMETFIRALRQDIRIQVELSNPFSFPEAERRAIAVEAIYNRSSRPQSNKNDLPRRFPFNQPQKATEYPQPMDLDNFNSKPLPKLDERERERCLKNNLCFRCRRPGHSKANCKGVTYTSPPQHSPAKINTVSTTPSSSGNALPQLH